VERLSTVVFHPGRADEIASALRADPRLADLEPEPVREPADLRSALVEASLLVTTNGLPADAFESATRLGWIHVAAAGVDGVVNAALPTGVRVTRTRGSFGERMTEYVCAHLLALAQDVHGFRAQQHAGVWRNRPVGHLAGKTAGVVGVGSIGRVIARRLAQFGMTVHGLARSAGDEPSVDRWFDPAEKVAFARDLAVVVITLPLTEATRGFVDRAFLDALPSGAWLVNVGRGAVVDQSALEAALFDARLGAAVLDVFEREPLPSDSPLWHHPAAIVTPHQAGDAIASEVADAVAENLAAWRMGRPMSGEVDLARAY
jgi:glyoxylate/hydroxypyruvate reductase A